MLVVSEENKLNGEENKTSVDCSNKLNSQKKIFEKFNVYLFLPRLGENRMRKVLFSPTDRIHLMIERVKCCDECDSDSVTLPVTPPGFIYKSKDWPVKSVNTESVTMNNAECKNI